MAEERFKTIVADPPWAYPTGFGSSPSSRRETPRGNGSTVRRALPYRSMRVDGICQLPVESLVADDAVLFLWTTNRYLRAAFDVCAAWGFRYSQTLVWRKTGNPSPLTGWIAPVHAEFLLVGKKGKPDVGRLESSVIEAPAPNCGQHSTKPEVFLDLIEQIGPSPYVELFARRNRLGWETWGDESLQTVELDAA